MVEVAEADEERMRRERQEAMERMLLAGEEADDDVVDNDAHENRNNDNNNNRNDGDNNNNDNINENFPPVVPMGMDATAAGGGKPGGLSYTTTSFLLAAGTLWYALRTREQWYLALVFLASSKVAYCVLGNALIAAAVWMFDVVVRLFLGGLRVLEAEGLQDFFRWNVTETCLALTMFRAELTVSVAVQFLALILVKCLHHVAVLREQHLRMTVDAIHPVSWGTNNISILIPVVPWHHCKVLLMIVVLQSLDLVALQYTAEDLLTVGPSVSILFAFESAILLVSAWSAILLWYIHVTDGLLHFWHEQQYSIGHVLIHPWKEYKATLTFAVELQAQAVQFLFYLAFFGFVMTYYGMPINLFREVYVSFMALKERLWAFAKYRRLMASMNRFATPTAEQLEEAGVVCIICRDDMTLHDCKALPGCGHLFHKSCLREWLTQQQSCPTCRADISSMEARQAAVNAANQRREATDGENENENSNNNNNINDNTDENENEQQDGLERQTSLTDGEPNLETEPAREVGNASGPAQRTSQTTLEANESSLRNDTSATTPTVAHTTSEHSEMSAPANTPKKVRFTATAPLAEVSTPLVFPALYRVVRERGALVWHVSENNAPRVVRQLPFGVIVFGTKQKTLCIAGERATDYVEIPDGWVADDAILRVCEKLDFMPKEQSASLST